MNTTPQAAPIRTDDAECNDCGGPLTQAFPRSTLYLRCRRCGHVTSAPSRARTS